jgi:hypothetical protein
MPVPKDTDGVSVHHGDHATAELILSGNKEHGPVNARCDDECESGCG